MIKPPHVCMFKYEYSPSKIHSSMKTIYFQNGLLLFMLNNSTVITIGQRNRVCSVWTVCYDQKLIEVSRKIIYPHWTSGHLLLFIFGTANDDGRAYFPPGYTLYITQQMCKHKNKLQVYRISGLPFMNYIINVVMSLLRSQRKCQVNEPAAGVPNEFLLAATSSSLVIWLKRHKAYWYWY